MSYTDDRFARMFGDLIGVSTTPENAAKTRQLFETGDKLASLNKAIIAAARQIVPVLLDAGRTHSAKNLQELFFEYDAMQQDLDRLAKEMAK